MSVIIPTGLMPSGQTSAHAPHVVHDQSVSAAIGSPCTLRAKSPASITATRSCTTLRGDSGLRSFVSVQGALCMYPIYKYGTEAQKQKWLPGMAQGKVIGAFGLTEPDYGSDPGGMITRARKKGDNWILNGTKFWITNGSICDIAIIWAKDDQDVICHVMDSLIRKERVKAILGAAIPAAD